MNNYLDKKCVPLKDSSFAKSEEQIRDALVGLAGWEFVGGKIEKTFEFKNYYETSAFVNAVVWIAHREDHHPDISFGYKTCAVVYSTHSVGGISDNDFICAAKINACFEG